MIVLSLILVIVAAVLLILGVLQSDGVVLIYLAIGSCLLAMLLLAVGVLVRRRPAAPGEPAGPPSAGAPGAGRAVTRAPGPDTGAVARETDEPARTERPSPSPQQESAERSAAGDDATPTRRTGKRAVVRRVARPGDQPVRAADHTEPVSPTGAAAAAGGPTGVPELSGIRGLGPAKQQALLDRFSSVEAIRDASIDELTEVRGIGPALARTIKDALS